MVSDKSKMNSKDNKYNFFISYSWKDGKSHATGIWDYLSEVLPKHNYFMDRQLNIAELNDIDNNLNSADYLILIVTPSIFKSACVKKEYEFAKNKNLGIIPCKSIKYDMPWKDLEWNIFNIGIDYESLDELKIELESKIRKISKRVDNDRSDIMLDNKINDKSKHEGITHSIKLEIISDRMIYPQNAVIYIKIILSDLIIDKKISFLLSDIHGNTILEKIIDPLLLSYVELDNGKMFKIKLMLDDPLWKNEKEYKLRAMYGNAEHTCNFMTNKLQPVIQTDKVLYMIDTDMIITVIDPSGDKDSDKSEIIGDKSDSLLTILYGDKKIIGYRLRETGTSTGIFQGVVHIIRNHDEKTHDPYHGDVTQCDELDVNCIQVRPGDRIGFEYYNGEKTVYATVHTSMFGATISLDQEVYSWRDTVYITITAPDFNYDSEKRDIIGNGVKGTVTASTSLGTISKFKMRETGTDTGVFTGEIKLTGFINSMMESFSNDTMGITKILDSGIGLLPTCKDDKITISFSYNGIVNFVSAYVGWYIGEIMWAEETYQIGDKGIIRIFDPDMSIVHGIKNKFTIKIYSDSDHHGVMIIVTETNISTGTFQGEVVFNKDTIKNYSIKVKKGDGVYAQYVDHTLPDPYGIKDALRITSKCKIK